MIFYAGHGIYDKDSDQGYWLPIDAQSTQRATWISNADITDTLRAIQANHILIVADSCYSGSLSLKRSVPIEAKNQVERTNKLRSRTVLAAGGLEPVLDGLGTRGFGRTQFDITKKHSVFTSALIKTLEKNNGVINGFNLSEQVISDVSEAIKKTPFSQTPIYSEIDKVDHQLGGDFLFVRR